MVIGWGDGGNYIIGGTNERTNLQVAKAILKELGKMESLVTFVKDRQGHERRYAIEASKIYEQIG
ncbi:hypothetical protein PbDSM24746_51940 [Paenibacillus macerans]|nr:hypothetical protein PbDSM24746_51940 [Paenibacillus macerans]GBK71431.1 hypothetical protein PbJCM17693_51390 [Paenibacillus macerans]